MLIDVRPILHIPGKELNFQFELDLSDMEFGGRNPISRPVIVEGAVRNLSWLGTTTNTRPFGWSQ